MKNTSSKFEPIKPLSWWAPSGLIVEKLNEVIKIVNELVKAHSNTTEAIVKTVNRLAEDKTPREKF